MTREGKLTEARQKVRVRISVRKFTEFVLRMNFIELQNNEELQRFLRILHLLTPYVFHLLFT